MIIGITNICLYTGLTPTGGNASASAQQWMDDNNIEYSSLWYGDIKQHADVFESLNSWYIGEFTDFPFVIYDEKHDDYTLVKQSLIGLDEITNSNLVELAAL